MFKRSGVLALSSSSIGDSKCSDLAVMCIFVGFIVKQVPLHDLRHNLHFFNVDHPAPSQPGQPRSNTNRHNDPIVPNQLFNEVTFRSNLRLALKIIRPLVADSGDGHRAILVSYLTASGRTENLANAFVEDARDIGSCGSSRTRSKSFRNGLKLLRG